MLLECLDDSFIGRLSLAVGLGVACCGVVNFDHPLSEVLELKSDELRAIVGDYLFWNSEVANIILLYEVLNIVVMDLMKGLNLDPLGKVVGNC